MWFAVTLSDGAFSKSRLRVLGLRVDLQRKAEGDQLPDGDWGAVPQLPVHPTLRSAASAYHGWRAAGGDIVALRATDKVRTHDHHTDPGKHKAFNFQREKEEQEQKQCYERKLKLQIQASNSESITRPQPRDSSQCTNCPPAVPPATCRTHPRVKPGYGMPASADGEEVNGLPSQPGSFCGRRRHVTIVACMPSSSAI